MIELRDASKNGYGLDIEAMPRRLKEAEAVGAPYYFTGKPCPHGHVAPRYTKSSICAFCTRERNAKKAGRSFSGVGARARRYAARAAAAAKGETTYIPVAPCKHGHLLRWTASNNCVQCDEAQRERHKRAAKYRRIAKEYGLTRDEYQQLVKAQLSSCAICGDYKENSFELHIDHCHKSGKVRALLCSRCNQAIGLLRDSPELARAAAEYLENA